jgi:hypothetical protein
MKRAAIYFLAGAGLDALITRYNMAVFAGSILPASSLSMLITFWSTFVLAKILSGQEDSRTRALLICAYALGNGVGTAAAMWMK